MKTFNFKAIIIAVMLLLLNTNNLSSQITPINAPFGIANALDCVIDGTWSVTALANTCGGSFCDNGSFSIPAQTVWPITQFNSCLPTDTEVECIIIVINAIGGQPVNIIINSNMLTINAQNSLSVVTGCTAPSSYYMMDHTNLFIIP